MTPQAEQDAGRYVLASRLVRRRMRLADSKAKVSDLLFDDCDWRVVHFVVHGAGVPSEREILVAPEHCALVAAAERIRCSRARCELSSLPDETTDEPVWRQQVYRMACYDGPPPDSPQDRHLRSVRELRGYRLLANEEQAGTVKDAVVWSGSPWRIRYLVVRRGRFLAREAFLLPVPVVRGIHYDRRQVEVYADTMTIGLAPRFEGVETISEGLEREIYQVFRGRPGDWWSVTSEKDKSQEDV